MEAATHSVRKSFQDENTEFLLLGVAENAFNKLNRKVHLENIKRLCQPIHNSYNTTATLYFVNRAHILSEVGVAQGDNAAVAMYTIST